MHPRLTPGCVDTGAPRATWTVLMVHGSSPHSSGYLTRPPLTFLPCTAYRTTILFWSIPNPGPNTDRRNHALPCGTGGTYATIKKRLLTSLRIYRTPGTRHLLRRPTLPCLHACLRLCTIRIRKKRNCQKKTLMSPTGLTWLGNWRSKPKGGPRCFTVE